MIGVDHRHQLVLNHCGNGKWESSAFAEQVGCIAMFLEEATLCFGHS
jgi:hypothetical protein